MTLGNRIGVFLILLGIAFIGLFILSDVASAPEVGLLAAGTLILLVGIYLFWKNPNPDPAPSGRFGIFKRKPKPKKEKKGKDKKDKREQKSEPPSESRPK